jgi:hypothetical protein
MILYRVSGDYNKGIKKVKIESINNDGTFNYKTRGALRIDNGIVNQRFIPKNGAHQPYFFLTYEEAKNHLSMRINEKIKEAKEKIKQLENIITDL